MNANGSPPDGESPRKERYGWIEYVSLIERLLRYIKKDFRPDQVIGISSGGLFPATILAKAFDAPLAVIAAESYSLSVSGIKDAKGPVQLGHNLASARPELGRNILLVDDLTDSGDTMSACANWLRDRFAGRIEALRTAVIWHKACAVWQPDFFAQLVEADPDGSYPWIVQPFEVYEGMAVKPVEKIP